MDIWERYADIVSRMLNQGTEAGAAPITAEDQLFFDQMSGQAPSSNPEIAAIGQQQAIAAAEAGKEDSGLWSDLSDIVSGVGTSIADNPLLTAALGGGYWSGDKTTNETGLALLGAYGMLSDPTALVESNAGGIDSIYSLSNGTGTFGNASALGTSNAMTGAQVAGMGGGTGLTLGAAGLTGLAEMGGGTGLLAGGMGAGGAAGLTGAGAGALSNAALVGAGLTDAAGISGLTGAGAGAGAGAGGAFDWTKLIGTGLNLAGGVMAGNSAAEAARIQADAQLEAARIAAEAARFKPVGVTTNFGSSKFGFDSKGNLTSAGYELSPWLQEQQNQLKGSLGGLMGQFTGAQAATAPMGTAAQQAMILGQGYLTASPQEQAAKYMAEQQALLATGRERDLSLLQSKLRAQGRLGLATGGTTTGMMAANPEMEAFFNAQRQQDLGLAAQATQGGMDYAKFGAGLVGTGGDLLKGMYGTQTAAYDPYKTALGGMQTMEGMGQNALEMGMDMGKTATAARAQGGLLTMQGMNNAANTMAPANAYSPWASLLSGAGQALSNYKWGT